MIIWVLGPLAGPFNKSLTPVHVGPYYLQRLINLKSSVSLPDSLSLCLEAGRACKYDDVCGWVGVRVHVCMCTCVCTHVHVYIYIY